ncbi:PTS system IIA component, Glc family [Virgibacillus subterraneus]|uniref:PTS system IIA component, Glc family n=1 Tax=Virgibacillus subterraneus TaxID=621109 RepID=A0A1H9FI34_9BACI|nr:PTS glucose transporter subunit IIA [Virgibacillus subterraneus]SEQ37610.1 PTS system IIA component, Glc family [Virgibacillus subterraneus]
MFKNLFKKESSITKIYAPINGEIVSLEEVPDPVFSQKMMGDGVAIKPNKGQVYSPVDGEVVQIPETKHAIGLRTGDGIEILIHIGLETVSLEGKGFTINVSTGDKVSVGEKLMEFDLEYVRNNASSDISPIVITNGQDTGKKFSMTEEKESTAGETVIITTSEQ